jgi:hypothetical protein
MAATGKAPEESDKADKAPVLSDEDLLYEAAEDAMQSFQCPITHQIMRDPVMTPDGMAFDRKAIVSWIKRHQRHPVTGAAIGVAELVECRLLREAINEYLEKVAGRTRLALIEAHTGGAERISDLHRRRTLRIYIVREKDMHEHHGHDLVPQIRFGALPVPDVPHVLVPASASLVDLKMAIETETDVPVDRQRLWKLIRRANRTMRVGDLVSESKIASKSCLGEAAASFGVNLGVGIRAVFLEEMMDDDTFPVNASNIVHSVYHYGTPAEFASHRPVLVSGETPEIMLFIKRLLPVGMRYVGRLCAPVDMTTSDLAARIRDAAGVDAEAGVALWEEVRKGMVLAMKIGDGAKHTIEQNELVTGDCIIFSVKEDFEAIDVGDADAALNQDRFGVSEPRAYFEFLDTSTEVTLVRCVKLGDAMLDGITSSRRLLRALTYDELARVVVDDAELGVSREVMASVQFLTEDGDDARRTVTWSDDGESVLQSNPLADREDGTRVRLRFHVLPDDETVAERERTVSVTLRYAKDCPNPVPAWSWVTMKLVRGFTALDVVRVAAAAIGDGDDVRLLCLISLNEPSKVKVDKVHQLGEINYEDGHVDVETLENRFALVKVFESPSFPIEELAAMPIYMCSRVAHMESFKFRSSCFFMLAVPPILTSTDFLRRVRDCFADVDDETYTATFFVNVAHLTSPDKKFRGLSWCDVVDANKHVGVVIRQDPLVTCNVCDSFVDRPGIVALHRAREHGGDAAREPSEASWSS